MTRSVMRYVKHRICGHPDIPPMHDAKCRGCGWTAPQANAGAVDIECMKHTGLSGHTQFERTASWVAFVVRDE